MAEAGGMAFSEFKPRLADLAVARLGPISSEMARLMQDQAGIDLILADGAARARAIAAPIIERTYAIMGMVGARRG
jgi:tryptophanyl-tRNA synthetase